MRHMGTIVRSWGRAVRRITGVFSVAILLAAMVFAVMPAGAFAAAFWSASGTLGTGSETDTYYVNVTPGVRYTVWTQRGSLPDPMLQVHDGGASYYDDDSFGNMDAVITFTAATSQISVVVTSYRQLGVGSYTVLAEVYVPPNSAPSAHAGSFSLNEDGSYSGNLSGSDPDNNPIVYRLSSGASHGTVSILGNGPAFTYVPTGNYNGSDSFSFYTSDGSLNSSAAWMTITVNSVLDPPVAAADSYTMDEDSMIIVNTRAAGVLNNDDDVDGGAITASLVSGPAHATQFWLNENGTFGYQPSLNWNGTDSFTYRPIEGGQYGNTVTVTLNVTAVNDVPVAVADSVSVTEDEFVSVAAPGVRANDPADIEGSALTSFVQTGPSHGAVVMQLDGSYVYTPTADYFGADTFTYRNFDGTAFGPAATVTVTVNGTPDAPVTLADSYSTNEDTSLAVSTAGARGLGVLANDIDVDLTTLEALLVTDVEHGTLTLDADGSFTYEPDANWYGSDSFEYNPYDGDLHGITISVPITVNSVNDLPVAVGDAYETDEDTVLTVDPPGLLANDSDPVEGSEIVVASVSTPATHGTIGLRWDGKVMYTPDPNYHGPDSFAYRISDGTDLSAPATVTITVDSVNDAPVAVGDSYSVAEDGTLSLQVPGVIGNDSDADGDSLTAHIVVGSPNGAQLLREDGSLIYQPSDDYNGPDWITYRVFDGTAYSNTATITLNVTSVNDAPVSASDSYSTDEDVELVVDAASGVLANDSDAVEDSPLTASLVDDVLHGTLSLATNGSFTYTPTANWSGADSFTYRAFDGTDYSATVTVSLGVDSVNDLPFAVGESYTTAEDTTLNIAAPSVLDNDSDPIEGSTLTAERVTNASHGDVTLFTNGQLVYVPDANYNGSDSFTYRAYDGSGYSNTVTVSLTITSVYDPPVAIEDTYTTNEDVTLWIDAPGLLDNDLGDGPLTILSWQDSAQGTAGTVTCWADGRLKYVPEPGFHGVDTFVYRITDVTNRSAYVTVTINVTHVNPAPVAAGDEASAAEDTLLTVLAASGVLANDSDRDNDPMTAELVSDVANGTLDLKSDGSYTYMPDADWNGTDSFTYRVFDETDYSDAVTVTLTVTPANDAPHVEDSAVTIDEDSAASAFAPGFLTGAHDVEGDPISADLVRGGINGSLVLFADGMYTYAPNANWYGTDAFSFRVWDGTEYSRTATVTITVNAVNDAPVAAGDFGETDEDTTLNGSSVLGNDSDVDDDALSAVLFDDVANGTLTLASDGTYIYVPDENWHGVDSFTYRASDGERLSEDMVTVAITVNAVNDAPVAADDSGETDEDTTLNGSSVLGNDTDIEDSTLTAVLVEDVVNGTLSLDSDGTYRYVPDENWNGEDFFTYKAHDGGLDSNVATVTITVSAVNDAPVASDDSVSTDEDTTLTREGKGSVLDIVSDVERDDLTAILVGDVAHGELTLDLDGDYTYAPDENWNGEDSFSYKANDGLLDSNVGTITITVDPVNDAPVAEADSASTDEDVTLDGSVLGNDTDVEDSTLSATLVDDVTNGTLTLDADGTYTYVPTENWNGEDSFTYKSNDGELDSNIVTVTITVNAVNDAPVAHDYSTSTDEDTALVRDGKGGLLGLVDDVEGDDLAVSLVDDVSHGTLTIDAGSDWVYVPDENWNGEDTFTFKANDGDLDSNVATVTITVTPVNDAPVAVDDSVSTDEDTLLNVHGEGCVMDNDTDVENSALTVTLVTDPAHGVLNLDADGHYTYAPDADWNGQDAFAYIANDGELDSATATVTITVDAVNDAPSFTAGDDITVGEDSGAYSEASWATSVVTGPANEGAQTLEIAIATTNPGLFATVPAMDSDGRLTFTPAANANGSAECTVTITDNGAPVLSADATFKITVNAVNDAPVANADTATTPEDTALSIDAAHGVLANDTDVEGDDLNAGAEGDDHPIKLKGYAAHGTLVLAADGSYIYTPEANWNGVDTFMYFANDGDADSAPAAITITVTAVNDAPTAEGESYSTDEDVELTIPAPGLLFNDLDVDGDDLSTVLVTDVENGELALHANGSFTFEPATNFNGTDSFTYKVSDGVLESDVVTVSLTIDAVDDAPVAHADSAEAVSGEGLTVDAEHGVLANDSDQEDGALSALLVTDPAHGEVVFHEDGSYVYTSDSGFTGSDSFTYRTFDGSVHSEPVAVEITVNPGRPILPSFKILTSRSTRVAWTAGRGALGYRIYVANVLVGTVGSADTSFTVPSLLGPGARVEIQAFGSGETHSPAVEAASQTSASAVRIGTIYFGMNSSTLTSAARTTLRANARRVKALGFKVMTVEAFTSKSAGSTYTYRKRLSTARAAAAKAYLTSYFKTLHYSVTIKTVASGYSHPVGSATDPRNRRAEISLR